MCYFLLTRCIRDLRDFKEACFPARISGEKTLLDAFFHSRIDARHFFFDSGFLFGVGRSSIACRWICLENYFGKRRRVRLWGYLRPKLCRARASLLGLFLCIIPLSDRRRRRKQQRTNDTHGRPVAAATFSHRTRRGLTSSFNYNNSSHSLSNNLQPFLPAQRFS
jgi:hypothetical protein